MTITKSAMQRAMQGIMQAFHLSGFTDNEVIEVGKMLMLESSEEWSDTHKLIVRGYNENHAAYTDKQGSHQW